MKITRKDLVRVAVEEVRARMDRELAEAEAGERHARAIMHEDIASQLLDTWRPMLAPLVDCAGTSLSALRVEVKMQPDDDLLEDPPAFVDVVVRDGASHDSRVQIRARVPMHRHSSAVCWLSAAKHARRIKERGMKLRDLGDEPIVVAIENLLGAEVEGREILRLLKVVADKVEL